ncbi:transposable element Tc3 transposase [Trichonephila clavipes]|nr:transposable element Tc3 transposase [Trichonephila clavipes]
MAQRKHLDDFLRGRQATSIGMSFWKNHIHLFRAAMGAEFLFMDDNARPRCANIVDGCLQSEDITRMDWPAYSPDLNQIEHVSDMHGRRIEDHQPPPTCVPELRRALLHE